jgi:thiol:disulfide interchange protein/DsbC/DsbD-like thiol-disulfide interchange protein
MSEPLTLLPHPDGRAARRPASGPLAGAAAFLGALVLAGASGLCHAAPVRTPHVTAELVAQQTAIQPGQTLQIGLRLQHIPHWHTYWRNPGDSGLPTSLRWTLPVGSSVSAIDWPAPQRLPVGPLLNYGYEGDLLLPMQYTAPADARPGETLTLRAKGDWLVCKEVCIPETALLELQLPVVDVGTTPGTSINAPHFARTALEQAAPLRGWKAELQVAGPDLLLTLLPEKTPATAAELPEIHVFPYAEQVIVPSRHEFFRTDAGYAIQLALQEGAKLPATFSGIAVAQVERTTGVATVWGTPQRAAEFEARVRSVTALEWPPGTQRPLPGASPGGGADIGLLAALGLALIGGMLLNLMPCVFPVLSIKLLALVQQRIDAPALRAHALAYGAGVVLSFMALAGALLALRAAGDAVGWGFQLQEPGVIFVLALLFFAIALNLAGLFELGQMLPTSLAAWRSRRPAADAFGAGVLAVVVASPCTAPFMGAALGFAITQSASVGLATFAMLGVGMALPYMLLVLRPAWRSRLPKPGAWMLHLKQAMAFPMFAAVVWLVWVLGLQTGVDTVARALLALVGLGLLVWLAGLPAVRGLPGRLTAALLLAGLVAWSWPATPAATRVGSGSATASTQLNDRWRPYDEAQVAQELAQGRSVFVDFTAAWCISCQVNKRLVLDTEATHAAFSAKGVTLMRADWTRRDENISQALARLGRSGVPVYALMSPGRAPVLLPEILTERVVRDALALLPAPRS